MAKFDFNGNLIWSKEGNYLNTYSENVSINSSYNELGQVDGYIMMLYGNNKTFLIKHDLEGNIVWQKEENYTLGGYASIGTSYNNLGKVDGYILAESYSTPSIMKYNLQGNLIWKKDLNYSLNSNNQNLVITYNDLGQIDGYVMTCYDSELNSYLVKLDLEGNIVWKKPHTAAEGSEMSIFGIYPLYNDDKTIDDYIVFGEGYMGTSANLYSYPKANIKSEDDTNRILQLKNKWRVGALVTVQVNPNTGYIFDKLIVTDITGKEIEVNGTSFVMPENDVVIKAVYKKAIDITNIKKPPTTTFWHIVLFIVFIASLGTYIVNKKTLKS